MNSHDSPFPYRTIARLALILTILIVYGSLVPFEYRAVTLDQAFNQFAHIHWLDIDLEGRADWVANLVLFFPFGFLICGALSRRSLTLAVLVTAMAGAALAVEIEFLQIWAEPRTVSLNDIVAEIAGTLVGIVAWISFGTRLVRAAQSVFRGGPEALRAAIVLYVLAYCFVILFPFDFLVSAGELHARLADPSAIVWIPRSVYSLRGLFSLVLKAALLSPLGAVFWLVARRGLGVTALAAVGLSGLLEVAHLFEYSEQCDAVSIAAALVGALAGNIFARLALARARALPTWLRRAALLAAPFYLLLLPFVRGWRLARVNGELIAQTFTSTHWLPFYYHYFTSEGHALASVVSISASFAPLGMLAWAVRLRPGEPAGEPRSSARVAMWAFILALILEAGVLVTAGTKPDPTNLLIAVAIAVLSQRVCEWLARVLSGLPMPAEVTP